MDFPVNMGIFGTHAHPALQHLNTFIVAAREITYIQCALTDQLWIHICQSILLDRLIDFTILSSLVTLSLLVSMSILLSLVLVCIATCTFGFHGLALSTGNLSNSCLQAW